MGMGSHLDAPATLTKGKDPPWLIKYEARWRRFQCESFGGQISCPYRYSNPRSSSPSRHVFRDLPRRLRPMFALHMLCYTVQSRAAHTWERKAYRVLWGKPERKNRLENLGAGGRPILKLGWSCELDDTGSGQGTVVGSCEHNSELSCSTKCVLFLDKKKQAIYVQRNIVMRSRDLYTSSATALLWRFSVAATIKHTQVFI
jgi:hypothetical protein